MTSEKSIAFLEYNNGLPFDDFVYISQYPLKDRGFEIHPTMDANIIFRKNFTSSRDIAVGSVEFVSLFYKSLNIQPPNYIGFPDSLQNFYYRNIWKTSLRDLLRGDAWPVFIKPYESIKLFTGTVIQSKGDVDLLKLYAPEVNETTDLWASEVIDLQSEYRIFVHSNPDGIFIKDKIVGIKHYSGNYKVFPHKQNIKDLYEIIENYANSPVCYSLDVGFSTDGSMYLIEINDFWALGSYGLCGKLYTKLLLDRHREIVKGATPCQ